MIRLMIIFIITDDKIEDNIHNNIVDNIHNNIDDNIEDNINNNIDDNRIQIWRDNKGKSGVYRWIKTVTGSYYIGSSTVIYRTIKGI